MSVIELVGAGVALVLVLGVGTVAHELAHGAVLRCLGVPYDVVWRPPGGDHGSLGLGVSKAWAAVVPRSIPRDVSATGLRLAAIAPLALATPAVLVVAGFLPDPLAFDNAILTTATVVWLGCALPSPQDFSLFWHVEDVIADDGGAGWDDPLATQE